MQFPISLTVSPILGCYLNEKSCHKILKEEEEEKIGLDVVQSFQYFSVASETSVAYRGSGGPREKFVEQSYPRFCLPLVDGVGGC